MEAESSRDVHLRHARQLRRILVRGLNLGGSDGQDASAPSDRAQSDLPLIEKPPAVKRSRSRSSLNSNESTRDALAPSTTALPSSATTTLTTVQASSQSRQRAASVASFKSDTPSIPSRLPNSTSSKRLINHHNNEHKANEEKWARERLLESKMTRAQCVLSCPDRAHILYCTEIKGPSCDFEWDVDSMLMTKQAEPRILVDIWANTRSCNQTGKGKQKQQDSQWTCVISWDVSLSHLVPLGRKPSTFPTFPNNTIILQFTDGEFFTAPFVRSAPSEIIPPRSLTETEEPIIEGLPKSSPEQFYEVQDPLSVERQIFHARKQFARDRRTSYLTRTTALERSVRDTKMLPSESLDDCFALVSMANEMTEERQKIASLTERLDVNFVSEYFQLKRDWSRRKDVRLRNRERLKEVQERNLSAAQNINTHKEELQKRRDRLKGTRYWLEQEQSSAIPMDLLKSEQNAYAQLQEDVKDVRARLVAILDSIFPIEPSKDLPSALAFSICDLNLPNSSYSSSISTRQDEEISSALGLTAQVVNILGAYIGVALYYPITPAGSRTLVADYISSIKGPKIFPLYSTGVEQYRFEYAVFLLNKDIEQLLQAEDILLVDLRQTLPNLKSLILTASSRAFSKPNFIAPKAKALNGNGLAATKVEIDEAIEGRQHPTFGNVTSTHSSPSPTIKAAKTPTPSEKVKQRARKNSTASLLSRTSKEMTNSPKTSVSPSITV